MARLPRPSSPQIRNAPGLQRYELRRRLQPSGRRPFKTQQDHVCRIALANRACRRARPALQFPNHQRSAARPFVWTAHPNRIRLSVRRQCGKHQSLRTRGRKEGSAQPRAQRGDRKSYRIEAHKRPSSRYSSQHNTFEELCNDLGEKDLRFGYGTIRRFFARHNIMRKKDGYTAEQERPDVPDAA